MIRAAWIGCVLLLGGCRQAAPFVRLQLLGAISPSRIELDVSLDGKSSQTIVDRGAPITLPDTLTLELPADASGDLAIIARAFDAAGTALGDGMTSVHVPGRVVVDATVSFSGEVDAGDGGIDLSPPNDLASTDQSKAPITFHGQFSVPPTTTNSISILRPSTVVAGDLMWIALFVSDATATLTQTPAGFTQHVRVTSGSCGGWDTYYFYKVATAGEQAAYMISFNSTVSLSAALVAFANVDPVAPIAAQTSNRYMMLPLALDLTTTQPDSMLLNMVIIAAGSSDPWMGPPAVPKLLGDADIAVFSGLAPTAGDTGMLSFAGPLGCGTYDFVALTPK